MEEHAAQVEEAIAKNGEYLSKMVTENGVQTREFNDDVWDAFGEAAAEVYEETRAHSDLAKRIDEAYTAAMREMASWRSKAEIAYVNQRNRVLDI